MANLNSKTKSELEEIGRGYGVELDRRLSKKKLVAQVQALEVQEEAKYQVGEVESLPLVDLKAEYVEEAPILKEVVPAPSGYSWKDGLLAENGILLTYSSRGLGRGLSNKKGGKMAEIGGTWYIKKN